MTKGVSLGLFNHVTWDVLKVVTVLILLLSSPCTVVLVLLAGFGTICVEVAWLVSSFL